MVLEIFTTLGGFIGILFVNHFSDRAIERAFGAVVGSVAVVMASRLERRNVIGDPGIETGALGGRFYDEESNREVAYRLKSRPVAFSASFLAGFVSTLGIGGGVLKVPALNAWCGVPMRVAAATSALMIGATAVVGSINYFVRGDVIPHLAAAAAVGVLLGAAPARPSAPEAARRL
jgi:uncharacterized membrane protein YfcA